MGSRHQLRRVPESPALLLADAEIAEDHVEQIFDIDRTDDAAETAQGQPEIRFRVKTASPSGLRNALAYGWIRRQWWG